MNECFEACKLYFRFIINIVYLCRHTHNLLKWVGTREPTRLTTGSGRVGLKLFYKFQYGLILDPTHLEPNSSGFNPW